jgi:hypothetical protein
VKRQGLQVKLAFHVSKVAPYSEYGSYLIVAREHQHAVEEDDADLGRDVQLLVQLYRPLLLAVDYVLPVEYGAKKLVEQGCHCVQRDYDSIKGVFLAALLWDL